MVTSHSGAPAAGGSSPQLRDIERASPVGGQVGATPRHGGWALRLPLRLSRTPGSTHIYEDEVDRVVRKPALYARQEGGETD